MKINKVVILANPSKSAISSALSEMREYFKAKGIETISVTLQSTVQDNQIEIPPADMAVSLGGDGTVLSCSSILKKTNIPLFAVNLGTFGYLAKIALSEYKDVFEEFAGGNSVLDKRMRLKATVMRGGKEIYQDSALNEFCTTSASRAKLAKFTLNINRTYAATLRGDGIIFATPSGSTAYNLSAGGPILDESISSIIVNPVCPFTLGVRPLVVSEDSHIMVEVPPQNGEMILTCDGHEALKLLPGDRIYLEKNDYFTYFVQNKRRNFIEVLRDKLGWASGINTK